MSNQEVERRLGYTPCICGNLDGTWHPECYVGKTKVQIDHGYRKAFAKARRHLKSIDEKAAANCVAKATKDQP